MNPRWAVSLLLIAATRPARATAQGFGFEMLGDAEAVKTDAGSKLLAQNYGNPAGEAEVYSWLAYQPSSTLRVLAIAEAAVDLGQPTAADLDLQLLSARWWHSRGLRIEAGKILLPIGEFAPRRFANVNPLIGAPDTYVDEYPWGGTLSGAVGPVDYSASVVSLPAVNQRYTPAPGTQFRPVLAGGISIGPGLRVGGAVTHGSYLGAGQDALLPAGTEWQDFTQTVATVDVHYSAGRTDLRGEGVWSRYQVPTVTDPVDGFGWYLESRVTLAPRWFVAARYEDNRYAFIQPVTPTFWIGAATTQMNGEVGVGYRLTADALVKTSLRKDHWPVHEIGATAFPDGYALAVQVSLQADIVQLLTRKP